MLSSLTAAPIPPAVIPASTNMFCHLLLPGEGLTCTSLAAESSLDVAGESGDVPLVVETSPPTASSSSISTSAPAGPLIDTRFLPVLRRLRKTGLSAPLVETREVSPASPSATSSSSAPEPDGVAP